MLYLLRTKYSPFGAIDIDYAIENAKENGGALVLADPGTYRAAPEFVRKCEAAGVPHFVGAEVSLTHEGKDVGKVSIVATRDSGVASINKILTKQNLSQKTIKNTKYGKTESSLGLNYFKSLEIYDLDGELEGVAVICASGSPLQKGDVDAVADLKQICGTKLLGATLSLGDKSKNYDANAMKAFRGRCVAVADINHRDDHSPLAMQGRFNYVTGQTCDSSLFTKFNQFAFGHKPYNDDVAALTNQLIENKKPYLILQDEAVPDIGLKSTFRDDVWSALDSYLEGRQSELQNRDRYVEAINKELSVIEEMGFAPYYDVVIAAAKHFESKGVPVRIRGSGASSMVMFLMGVSSKLANPLDANLLLSRFITTGRMEYPDVDIELPSSDWGEFIEFAQNYVGSESVGSLINEEVPTSLSKCLEIGVFGYNSFAEKKGEPDKYPVLKRSDFEQLRDLFIKSDGKWRVRNLDMHELLSTSKLTQTVIRNPKWNALISAAKQVYGLNTKSTKHLSGVVISPNAKFGAPSLLDKKGRTVVEASGNEAKNLGLVKFDIISSVVLQSLKTSYGLLESKGKRLDIDLFNLPDDFFDFLKSNVTLVTNFNGKDVRKCLPIVNPNSIEDMITAIAISRPNVKPEDLARYQKNKATGQMDMPQGMDDPVIKKIFEPTKGVFLLDEQILEIGHEVAGLSDNDCDKLRTAIRKSKHELFDSVKSAFVEGAMGNGRSHSDAEGIFEALRGWIGNYSFNKAHAFSYVTIAVEQLLMKYHYPVEAYQGLWSSYKSDTDSRILFDKLVSEYKDRGIQFIPPNVKFCDFNNFAGLARGENKYIMPSLERVSLSNDREILKSLEKLKDKGELPSMSLFDVLEYCYTDFTGYPKHSYEVASNPSLVSDFIEDMQTLIYYGCFDTFGVNSTQSIDADMITRREELISFVEPLVENLASVEPKRAITPLEVELDVEEMIKDEYKAFLVSPVKQSGAPAMRYRNEVEVEPPAPSMRRKMM
ncbi:DNA-directed DNA polymerase [Vibrio chagasii]|nr:DNA-directed DNA polymerase [Vibrio chagasii]